MEIFLNIGLAWISVLAAIVLILAYFTRKSIVKFPRVRKLSVRMNKALRKHHKLIGIVLILTALVHGLFSSDKLLSVNLGTVSWILSILLGINWMLRKRLINFKGWMFYHRILVIVFSLSIVIHVVDVGGIQVFNLLKTAPVTYSENQMDDTGETIADVQSEPITTGVKRHRGGRVSAETLDPSDTTGAEEPISTSSADSGGSKYIDGIYTGEATGYRPGLVVSVEIQNGEISSIDIVSHNEVGSRFYTTPMTQIPRLIISGQDTTVDAISGATKTSNGIINAVEDALAKARDD